MEKKNKKLINAILFGIILGFSHFLLSYYIKKDTSPKQVKKIEKLARLKKDSFQKIKKDFLALVKKADIMKLYKKHLLNHYGDLESSSIIRQIEARAPKKLKYSNLSFVHREKIKKQIYRLSQKSQTKVTEDKIHSISEKLLEYAKKVHLKEIKKQEIPIIFHPSVKIEKLDKDQIFVIYRILYALSNSTDKNRETLREEFSKKIKDSRIFPIHSSTRGWIYSLCAFLIGALSGYIYSRSKKIYTKILLGMLAGAGAGYLFGQIPALFIEPVGKIFIQLIKMVVVPLVFASLSLGVISLGDIRKVGKVGGKTLIYYLATTAFAIIIGLVLANLAQPGKYVSKKIRDQYQQQYQKTVQKKTNVDNSFTKILVDIIPSNPIEAMVKARMLQIIFFALFFGLIVAGLSGDKKKVLQDGLDGINEVMIRMVTAIMKIAPFGVFALMANSVALAGASILKALLAYSGVVLLGLILHILFVYGTLVRIFTGITLVKFLKKIRSVQMLAFSTSSSAATLPITMNCAEKEFGVSKEISSFVLPLGATINMDGTALYQGVAAVFIAQAYGIPLDFLQQLTILFTATIASIGTAAVPGAGIVILAMVLESIGVPTAGIAIIMGVDRILDMCRTTVNVTGDLSATLFVNSTEEKKK